MIEYHPCYAGTEWLCQLGQVFVIAATAIVVVLILKDLVKR